MLFLAALARLEAVGSEISGTVQARDVEAEPAAIAYVPKPQPSLQYSDKMTTVRTF